MNNKYFILYPLIVLSYNVYFKAMIGLDNRFLPKELCQKNVRDIIQSKLFTNNYLIGLQEAEAIDFIIPKNISKKNYIIGKSGEEKMVTIWSDNFKLIKSYTTDFHKGRPIQMSLLRNQDETYLFVNIHAPHDYQNFGNYKGKVKKDNILYSKELISMLNHSINDFLKNIRLNINRIIIVGDFNEYQRVNYNNHFEVKLIDKTFRLYSDENRLDTCCLFKKKNFTPSDYIFDSKHVPDTNISSFIFPASDHLPIETILY